MEIAAGIAVVLLAVIGVFQVALALGTPLGRAAWGGRHEGVLPTRLRLASGVAAAVYAFVIALVLASAGLIANGWQPGTGRTAMWLLVGFFGLGTVANAASPSRIERVWSPVSLAIAICCAIIALGI